jgi:membrane protease YdiL (CAAX protease family)
MNAENPSSKPGMEALWTLLMAFAMGSVVAALAFEPLNNLFGDSARRDWLLQLFAAVGFFVLPAAWMRTRRQVQQLPSFSPEPLPIAPLLLVGYVLLPALAAFSLEQLSWGWHQALAQIPALESWWAQENDQAEKIQALLNTPHWIDRLGVALVLVPLAALGEEFFFRGTLLPLWKDAHGTTWALLLSTAVFAVAHFNLSQLPFLLGAGLLLGWSYLATQRLWVPMAAHFLHNGITLIAAWQTPDAAYGLSDAPPHSWVLVALSFLSSAGLLAWLLHARRLAKNREA